LKSKNPPQSPSETKTMPTSQKNHKFSYKLLFFKVKSPKCWHFVHDTFHCLLICCVGKLDDCKHQPAILSPPKRDCNGFIWTFNNTQYINMKYSTMPFLPKGISRWKGVCCNLKRKHESNIYGEKHYSLVNCNFRCNMT
jgi:hypothetical protein